MSEKSKSFMLISSPTTSTGLVSSSSVFTKLSTSVCVSGSILSYISFFFVLSDYSLPSST